MQFQQVQSVNINGGTVTVGSITGTVNVSGTVGISGGSVSISGTPNVNVTGGSITISSGSVAISAGTITNIVDNVVVQSAVESLYSTAWNPAAPITQGITLPQQVQGFRVLLSTVSANVQNIEIGITNNTNEDTQTVNVQMPNVQMGSSANVVVIPFQVSGNAGDSITFSAAKNAGGGAAATINVALIGVGESPATTTVPGAPLEVYQIGGFQKVKLTFASAGTTQILPAPPSGMCYRLHRLLATASFANLLGNPSGFLYGNAAPASTGPTADSFFGLLAAEALNIQAGAALTAHLAYDLISIPDIL